MFKNRSNSPEAGVKLQVHGVLPFQLTPFTRLHLVACIPEHKTINHPATAHRTSARGAQPHSSAPNAVNNGGTSSALTPIGRFVHVKVDTNVSAGPGVRVARQS